MSDVTFQAKLEATNERLRRSAEDAKMRCTEMEARAWIAENRSVATARRRRAENFQEVNEMKWRIVQGK